MTPEEIKSTLQSADDTKTANYWLENERYNDLSSVYAVEYYSGDDGETRSRVVNPNTPNSKLAFVHKSFELESSKRNKIPTTETGWAIGKRKTQNDKGLV